MGKVKHKTQNDIDIEKYEQEIAYWEERERIAYKNEDWSARNWAIATLNTKREALDRCKQYKRKRNG